MLSQHDRLGGLSQLLRTPLLGIREQEPRVIPLLPTDQIDIIHVVGADLTELLPTFNPVRVRNDEQIHHPSALIEQAQAQQSMSIDESMLIGSRFYMLQQNEAPQRRKLWLRRRAGPIAAQRRDIARDLSGANAVRIHVPKHAAGDNNEEEHTAKAPRIPTDKAFDPLRL